MAAVTKVTLLLVVLTLTVFLEVSEAQTATTATNTLSEATTLTNDLQRTLQPINSNTSPVDVQKATDMVLRALHAISAKLHQGDTIQGQAKLSTADANKVIAAYKKFVTAQMTMLNTLIEKHLVFAQFGVTGPIAASLQSLEAQVDNFSFAVTSILPAADQPGVTKEKDNVDSTLGTASSIYQQICIPSPLYPSIRPICVAR